MARRIIFHGKLKPRSSSIISFAVASQAVITACGRLSVTSLWKQQEHEVASQGAALLLLSCMETAPKLVIWELFVCEQDFPRGHMGREIQLWIKEKKI